MASPIEVILVPALMMLLGFFLKYIGFLKQSDRDLLSNIVLYIMLPAMVFINLKKATISNDMLYLPVLGIALSILLLVPAYVYCKVRKYDERTTWTILLAASLMNTGFIGFPVSLGVFGDAGFLNAVFFDLSTSVMVVSYGVVLAKKFGGDAREAVKSIVTFMPLWAVIFGLLFNALDITSLGYVLDTILEYLAGATIPMIMLALGLSLDFRNVGENFTDSIVVSVIKLVISPLIVLVLLILLNIHGMVFNIAILEAGMSTAGNALVLAISYNLDKDLMGSLIFTNVVLSIVTLTAIISLLTGAI
ncbi:MAG: AEC family transporter [Methanobrevibacter sp.]|nr:AEC family transporter [Methanobrevibacter sp.]